MSAANDTPAFTTAKLLYFVEPEGGVRAFQHINADSATGERKKNFTREEKEMVIENLRGKEDTVSLDTTGFQYFRHTSKHTSFANDEEIYSQYYPESIELIKKLTGASRVELFDHTIRRRRPGQVDDHPDRRQPVAQVHVDQTTRSSIARVHRHLPASDAPKLLEKRFQIINLWRPIGHPAIDWPLALCDYRSVEPNDTVPVALVYDDREGETLGVKYNPNHKWKYLHGMTPEEIVLIKCFDSVQDGSVAIFTPHTGFSDPNTPEGTPLRESIELRALVFYD
ncbi:Aspirochlorine biosynthesis protein N [Psilocybe cubensis]|uniref:7alpha-cephem-methoxylase P8 chain n=2 Tax=Psilocybe cubensis TaxID=181762 RepID=A0A8H7XN99_PSICU|nr:Aspirochlorine biosynthesis protein N [Psilocybe cubensis]KAH9476240.1 Aspirochlorine biosynthesis protein N [Psilocybe cubensis]